MKPASPKDQLFVLRKVPGKCTGKYGIAHVLIQHRLTSLQTNEDAGSINRSSGNALGERIVPSPEKTAAVGASHLLSEAKKKQWKIASSLLCFQERKNKTKKSEGRRWFTWKLASGLSVGCSLAALPTPVAEYQVTTNL